MWKRWFPDYQVPVAIEDLVMAGVLVDGTHKNDATPHFDAQLADGYLVLWVDHPRVEKRYFPEGPRYMIDYHRPKRILQTVFETNRLEEALAAMENLMSGGNGLRLLP